MTTFRQSMAVELLAGFAFSLGIAVVYALYSFGFSGGFYYDDVDHLEALPGLSNTESMVRYVFAGETGPLGRPLAMASFLLHISDWPNNAEHIFRVNALLHLINGLLLALLVRQWLALFVPNLLRQKEVWLVVGSALLWLSLPLLTTTSLLAVQRMNGLSASFILLGLFLYARGLTIREHAPVVGTLLQVFGIAIGTGLSSLAKEVGLLMPVYALVLETTLWRGSQLSQPARRLRLIMLGTYFLAIVGYLGQSVLTSNTAFMIRDFTLGERLLNQAAILWDYLRQGFLPRTLNISPFHDEFEKVSTLVGALAMLAWLVIGGMAVMMRDRWPVFSFAVLWFLAGHLLESTVLPLELYFEHRNYLPMAGPVFALMWWVGNTKGRLSLVAVPFMVAYQVLIWVLLWQTTSLWGERRLAAEIWHYQHPASPRAAHHLAAYHANVLSDGIAALRVFDATASVCPRCIGTQLSAVPLACRFETPEQVAARMAKIRANVQTSVPGPAPVVMLGRLDSFHSREKCPGVQKDDLVALNQALLEVQGFRIWKGPARGIHYNLYVLARARGDQETAWREMSAAWQVGPKIDMAAPMVGLMVEQGRFEEARQFVAKLPSLAPINPMVAWLWRRESEHLARQLQLMDKR